MRRKIRRRMKRRFACYVHVHREGFFVSINR
jgi:hypothetical protein